MYEEMFKVGIKSGRNNIIYYFKHGNQNRRKLIELDEEEEYLLEQKRLTFSWNVTDHSEDEI